MGFVIMFSHIKYTFIIITAPYYSFWPPFRPGPFPFLKLSPFYFHDPPWPKTVIILLQPTEYWNSRCMSPNTVYHSLFFFFFDLNSLRENIVFLFLNLVYFAWFHPFSYKHWFPSFSKYSGVCVHISCTYICIHRHTVVVWMQLAPINS